MSKKIADYRDHMEETMKALDEDRVLLVTQGKSGPPNVMAIGWGMIGIVWRRPIFTVLVRPSRYTYPRMEEGMDFTVNIVPSEMKEVVQFCGTVSGRDHDKFKEKGMTALPSTKVTSPLIKEAILHFECRVVGKIDLVPGEIEKIIVKQLYPKGDFHRVYFGEIVACHQGR